MAGRPPLRIGQHGKIARVPVSQGVWIARCRFRDSDGVTRIVERRSPPGYDQHGKAAEDALLDSFRGRRAPGVGDITRDTKVILLADTHIDRLEEDGKSAATIETYRRTSANLVKLIGGLSVGETTAPRIDAALRSMRTAHGAGMARHARGILRGGLQLAVMAGALDVNPARDVSPIKQNARPKGARALTPEEFARLLADVQTSQFCIDHDLVDPMIMLLATGVRRSELLGFLWSDYTAKLREIEVTGKVVRVTGKGLQRFAETKSAAGQRAMKLPQFAVDMLERRRKVPYVGDQPMIFPSTAGTYRDPNNFNRDWRRVRDDLGLGDVKPHSFRKTVATMIDEEGLSARVAADQLGHAKPSMTQDRYMSRGRVHTAVADLLDRRAIVSDE